MEQRAREPQTARPMLRPSQPPDAAEAHYSPVTADFPWDASGVRENNLTQEERSHRQRVVSNVVEPPCNAPRRLHLITGDRNGQLVQNNSFRRFDGVKANGGALTAR